MSADVSRLRNEDGFDVTEGVQVILDAFAHGMEAGSGMLDWREQCAIRKVAWALGLNPDDFTASRFKVRRGEHFAPMRQGPYETSWPDPADPLTDEPPRPEDGTE